MNVIWRHVAQPVVAPDAQTAALRLLFVRR